MFYKWINYILKNNLNEKLLLIKYKTNSNFNIEFNKISLYFNFSYKKKKNINLLFHLILLEQIFLNKFKFNLVRKNISEFKIIKKMKISYSSIIRNVEFFKIFSIIFSNNLSRTQNNILYFSSNYVHIYNFINDFYLFKEVQIDFNYWVDSYEFLGNILNISYFLNIHNVYITFLYLSLFFFPINYYIIV